MDSAVSAGYSQGLINEAERSSNKIPLMTEAGFDRLIPYETGFCGMASLSFPKFKDYDDLWGKGNWTVEPVSVFAAHGRVIFYQHNLSDDVLSDSDQKITWNMVHGYGLSVARTFIRQNLKRNG